MLYPIVAYMKRIDRPQARDQAHEALPAALDAWAKRIEALPYFDKTFPPHWK